MKPVDLIFDPSKAKEVPAADFPKYITAIGVLRDRAELALGALTARIPTIWNGDRPAPRQGLEDELTIAEVISHTKAGRSTIYAAIRSGDLPARAVGKKGKGYRVRPSDLRAWQERSKVR